MSITKILTDKKMTDEEKLERVAEIVAGARETYGNTDTEIESVKVSTVNGLMDFIHLENESKVLMLREEVANIKVHAVEASEQVPGLNINKKIEELIATNGMLANIDSGVTFEYI